MSTGFKVIAPSWDCDLAFLDEFRNVPVANISDAMFRMNAAGASIRPRHSGTKLVGRALTVRTSCGDNLLVYKAITMCRQGDVIVIDAGGDLTNAIVGELLATFAVKRNAAGMVIDGAVRDIGVLRESDFPIFAAGVTHRGPYKNGPGEINVPVTIGRMSVLPGDLILGDADGVIAIPYQEADEILRAAQQRSGYEDEMREAIRSGRFDVNWVDKELLRLGCELP